MQVPILLIVQLIVKMTKIKCTSLFQMYTYEEVNEWINILPVNDFCSE